MTEVERARYAPALWILSGLLFAAAFLHPWLWWLSVPGVACFIKALVSAPSARSAGWGSLIAGTLKAGGAILWFFAVYPISWVSVESPVSQFLLIFALWAPSALSLGAGLAVAGMIAHALMRAHSRALMLFPLLFVGGEVFGSFLFSLYTLGAASTPNVHFSFGYAGYLAAHLTFLRSAAVAAGIYGLSLIVAFAGLALYALIEQGRTQRRKNAIVGTVFVALAFLAGSSAVVRNTDVREGTSAIAIETSFEAESAKTDTDAFARKQAAVRDAVFAALDRNPDVVLLPEDSRLTGAFDTPEETLSALSVSGAAALVVDTSRWKDERDATVLRAFYYDLAEGRVSSFDKRYLVPQGEFVPHIVSITATAFGGGEIIADLRDDLDYRPAAPQFERLASREYPVVLFCSESASPLLLREVAAQSDRDFVLHPVSHARFHGSAQLARELDAMARVHAIASGRSVVMAGNMIRSAVYRPDGRIDRGEVVHESADWRLVEYEL